MSKSKGNVIPPEDVVKKYGSDILRLWVASEDYRSDIKVSFDRFDQLSQAYMRLRNTLRFLLGNLNGFDPAQHAVPHAQMPALERFALHRLSEVISRTLEAYDAFEFHRVVNNLLNYCSVDLGAFYLDILKDRLYCDAEDAPRRRASQTVFFEIAHALVRLMAPVLPHTADEVWENLPGTSGLESVHLAQMPSSHSEWLDHNLAEGFERLIAARDVVLKPIEKARKKREEAATDEKFIGNSLEAAVTIHSSDPALRALLEGAGDLLPELFIVSKVTLSESPIANPRAFTTDELPGLSVLVTKAPGQKCERCWKTLEDVGTHADHPTLCGRCADVVRPLMG
jgi:isoleucyl-tRNA synthetase